LRGDQPDKLGLTYPVARGDQPAHRVCTSVGLRPATTIVVLGRATTT
jgi:hypothetical protein